MNYAGGIKMKVHISLNVSDFDASVSFYERMLDANPVKLFRGNKDAASSALGGYAKFDIAEPPLNLTLNERKVTKGTALSHLGLQVDSTEGVLDFKKRWENSGLITREEMDVICCYARQDKVWVRDPDGNEWEAFTVLENVETLDQSDGACCAGDSSPKETVVSGTPVSCC